MPEADLFSASYDFAETLAEALIRARVEFTARNEVMRKDDLKRIIREQDALRLDRPNGKKSKPRNLLLDTLVSLNGADPLQVSPTMFKQAASALAAIKAVCPNVTPDEIKRRAANYRGRFPNMTVSCTALSKWWGDCDKDGKTRTEDRTENFRRF